MTRDTSDRYGRVGRPEYARAGTAYALAIGKDPGGDQLVRVALGVPLLEDRARRGRVVLRRAQEAAHASAGYGTRWPVP